MVTSMTCIAIPLFDGERPIIGVERIDRETSTMFKQCCLFRVQYTSAKTCIWIREAGSFIFILFLPFYQGCCGLKSYMIAYLSICFNTFIIRMVSFEKKNPL